MARITEKEAWKILENYVKDLLTIEPHSLRAVFAIGSLPGGYYRAGLSDIDAVLIVTSGSQAVWGDIDNPSAALASWNQHYSETYAIPKEFSPFPVQEHELYPPYPPEKGLTSEIARLKLQGKCVYGRYPLETVPMPTPEHFLKDAQHFEEWWRDVFSKSTPLEKMSGVACVNTILAHLSRFLRVKKGVIEFDKRKLIRTYLAHDPPVVDADILKLVEELLSVDKPSEEDAESLRRYVPHLRSAMNTHLGISV